MFSFILIIGILYEQRINIIHIGTFTNPERSAFPRFIELFIRERLLFENLDDILITCDVKKEDL